MCALFCLAGDAVETVVLAMPTVVVVRPLLQVTQLVVVHTVTLRNRTMATVASGGRTFPASMDPEAHRPPPTAFA